MPPDVDLKSPRLTWREQRYVNARLEGLGEGDALVKAGFSRDHPARIVTQAMREEYERLRAEVVARTAEQGLITALEIHEQLTDELRGDVAELYNEAGELKPIAEWPLWARQGGVEFVDEPNMVLSTDGKDSSWDQKGRKIRVLGKSRHKARELAAKLKSVDALVAQKAGDVNIVVLTAEKARAVAGAKKRLAKVIDVTPEKTPEKKDT